MEDCSWTRSYDSYQLQPQRDLSTLPHSSWPSARTDPYFFGDYGMDPTATVEPGHMQNDNSHYLVTGATEHPRYLANVTSPPMPSLPDGDYSRRGRQESAIVSAHTSRARSVQPPRTFKRPSARPRSTTTVISAPGSSNVLPMQPVPFWDSQFLPQSSSSMDNYYSQPSLKFSTPILSNGDGHINHMIPQQDFCFTQDIGVALQPLPTMPDHYSQPSPARAIPTSPIRASRMTPWPEGADFPQTSGADSAVIHMAHADFPPGQRPKIATDAVKKASERRRIHAAKFKCEWPGCVSDFTTKHNLHNHLNSHLGIRNYQCDVCKRTFGVAHVLTRHRKKCRATDSN